MATGTEPITTDAAQLRQSRRVVGRSALCGMVLFLVSFAG